MGKRLDCIPGSRFGSLTIVEELEPVPRGRGKERWVKCLCDCGDIWVGLLTKLYSGLKSSCNGKCLSNKIAALHYRHGLHDTPIYAAWGRMRVRCCNAGTKCHPNYTNVKCDSRWETIEGFLTNPPLAESPFGELRRDFEPGLHLCRTNDIGDYSPENCRWDTKSNNAKELNLHKDKRLQMPSGAFVSDIAFEKGLSYDLVRNRIIKLGWSIEQALNTSPEVYKLDRKGYLSNKKI